MSERIVFLLWHSRPTEDEETDDKLIGIYSSREEAEAAIARKLKFEGFRDYPQGFSINPYELNRDYWSEGFVTDW